MGEATTFYLEGGRGDNYWSGGWHLGIIKAIPIKGSKKGFAQVELASAAVGYSDGKGHNRNGTPLAGSHPRGYFRKAGDRYWVTVWNLNEPGDTTYHGPRLEEMIQERVEEKQQQQNKAKA